MDNLAANIGRALNTSVYYWKESGVHSFYSGVPNSSSRQTKLIGEATRARLHNAGMDFLSGIWRGRACFDEEREQYEADRKAWAEEKANILAKMALMEKAVGGLKKRLGHAGPAAPSCL